MNGDGINWADVITELGVIGVLLMGIWAFLKGKIWPEAMVNKTIKAQQEAAEQSARIIASELGDKMKNGVAEGMEQGIARGYLKVNTKKD